MDELGPAKALILNGGAPGDEDLARVQEALEIELGSLDWESEAYVLHSVPVAYCTGCFECWTKTPGVCKTKDAGRDIARSMIGSDLTVFITPVTFGGYSSELKKAIDRVICLVSPFFARIRGEVHHEARYDRYPSLLGLGVLPEPDEEEEWIFHSLVARNALNAHAPSHASHVLYRGEPVESMREILGPILARVGRAA